ncbi:MAG: serine protease [Fibrobacteria bacterium]|nr:serine protease [Fibrobacteria bacterium]
MLRPLLLPLLALLVSTATATPENTRSPDSVAPSPATSTSTPSPAPDSLDGDSLPTTVASDRPVAKSKPTAPTAVVIAIHGEVDEGLRFFVNRAVDAALAQSPRPSHIVFDVDTWGGRLDAAFEISDKISSISQCSTIAFIKKKAISAGALIALSANRVYMAPGATIGDCAPILAGGGEGGIQYAGEKIESPLRARFRALARRNGFPIVLAEKMVSRDGAVLRIERPGEPVEFVSKSDWDALADSSRSKAKVKVALEDGQLLTMDDAESLEWGFSQGTFPDAQALERARGWSETTTVESTWSEDFARWISPFVSVLFLIGIAALYLEYKNPGFGVFGVVGLLALGLALGSQYLVGLADHTELLLAGIGVLLIGLEVLLFPGTVVLAGSGLILLAVALILSLQGFTIPDPSMPWQMDEMRHNILVVLGTLVGGMFVSFLAMKWVVPHLPGTSGAYLKDTLEGAHSPAQEGPLGLDLVGLTGHVVAPCRPVGRIRLPEGEFDAVSDGELLDVGAPIVVVGRRPTELVVRREEVAS